MRRTRIKLHLRDATILAAIAAISTAARGANGDSPSEAARKEQPALR
jgi:hypothetical protein